MWDGVASLTRSVQQWCTLGCESLASLVAEVTWQHLCPRLLKLDKQSCSVQACFSSDAMPTGVGGVGVRAWPVLWVGRLWRPLLVGAGASV